MHHSLRVATIVGVLLIRLIPVDAFLFEFLADLLCLIPLLNLLFPFCTAPVAVPVPIQVRVRTGTNGAAPSTATPRITFLSSGGASASFDLTSLPDLGLPKTYSFELSSSFTALSSVELDANGSTDGWFVTEIALKLGTNAETALQLQDLDPPALVGIWLDGKAYNFPDDYGGFRFSDKWDFDLTSGGFARPYECRFPSPIVGEVKLTFRTGTFAIPDSVSDMNPTVTLYGAGKGAGELYNIGDSVGTFLGQVTSITLNPPARFNCGLNPKAYLKATDIDGWFITRFFVELDGGSITDIVVSLPGNGIWLDGKPHGDPVLDYKDFPFSNGWEFDIKDGGFPVDRPFA